MATDRFPGTQSCNRWEWVPLVLSGRAPSFSAESRSRQIAKTYPGIIPYKVDYGLLTRWGNLQCRKRSIDRSARRRQEDHEAFQHARPVQENISRTEAIETFAPRKCALVPSLVIDITMRNTDNEQDYLPERHFHFPARGYVRVLIIARKPTQPTESSGIRGS